MGQTMASSVISQPIGVIAELRAIIEIHKYKGFHQGQHFILMAMEVHGALGCNMDNFIMECAHFSHDKHLGGHLSLSFCIHFYRQCVSIVLQRDLAFAIERKIAASDVCSRHSIIINLMICMHATLEKLWVK